jgi:hypothetical protein
MAAICEIFVDALRQDYVDFEGVAEDLKQI